MYVLKYRPDYPIQYLLEHQVCCHICDDNVRVTNCVPRRYQVTTFLNSFIHSISQRTSAPRSLAIMISISFSGRKKK